MSDELFEWGNGREARDEGMGRVLENTPEYFRWKLYMVFWTLVDSGLPFTAEDARPWTGDPPNHPNAYGANWSVLVNRAFREGVIVVVGWTKADRTKSHACSLPIYQGFKPGVEVDGF
jgi:hypothetical protein